MKARRPERQKKEKTQKNLQRTPANLQSTFSSCPFASEVYLLASINWVFHLGDLRSNNDMRGASSFLLASILLLFGTLPIICNGCPNNCSRNGNCNSDSICECSSGWTGGDCSVRVCPYGIAFSDVAVSADTAHQSTVCSGRGICHEGECVCDNGFTGIACERTQCKNDCSHNGQCVSMQHLADKTRNHDSQQYSYNQIWDADKIFGCLCDEGYDGYDCSLRTCPRVSSTSDLSIHSTL